MSLELTFGKHRGKKLEELPLTYVLWLAGLSIREGDVYNRFEETANNMWENRESLSSSCFCGQDVPIGSHRDTCYGFVLRATREDTRDALAECYLDGTAKFRDVSYLRPWLWVQKHHSDTVTAARAYLKGKCVVCGGKLVPIGTSRANGRDHDDWDSRMMHKKCWLITKDEE